jgi:hypothetical protein
MTYPLKVELSDPFEDAIDSVISEVEEAIENIRKYSPSDLERTIDVDLEELLADHQAIAIVWDTSHVKDQRPDLSEEQAWEVLQAIDYDRLNDPMLETIRHVAENLHPRKRQPLPAKAGQIIAEYGDGDERKNLVDLLTDAMHWCEGFGEPFEEFYGSARIHFAEETKSSDKGA